jgi:hypothetical protein
MNYRNKNNGNKAVSKNKRNGDFGVGITYYEYVSHIGLVPLHSHMLVFIVCGCIARSTPNA